MKKIISALLITAMLISSLSLIVFAEETVMETVCNDDYTASGSAYNSEKWEKYKTYGMPGNSAGKGLTMQNKGMQYKDLLGDEYVITVELVMGDTVYGSNRNLSFVLPTGDIFRFGGDATTDIVSADGTVLAALSEKFNGHTGVITVKFEVNNGKLNLYTQRLKVDGVTIDKVSSATDITLTVPAAEGKFAVAGMNHAKVSSVKSVKIEKPYTPHALSIMPEIAGFGENTDDGIVLHFSASVDADALAQKLTSTGGNIGTITMSDGGKTATISFTPTGNDGSACSVTIAGDFRSINGDWMGENDGDNTAFTYSFIADNNTILNSTPVPAALTSQAKHDIYGGMRFVNELYYTGSISLKGESHVYFATVNSDTEFKGYRLKIVPDTQNGVTLQSFGNGEITSNVTAVTSSVGKFKVGDTVKFGIEISNGGQNADIFVLGEFAGAHLSAAELTPVGRFVGVGYGGDIIPTFSNLKVLAKGSNASPQLEALDMSSIFKGYSVYKATDAIDVTLTLNVSRENINETDIYKPCYRIDNGEKTVFSPEEITENNGKTILSTTVSGLENGLHQITVTVVDAMGDERPFVSENILISDTKATVEGFTDSGDNAVASLADTVGQPLTVKFNIDYGQSYDIFIVLRNTETGEVTVTKQNVAAQSPSAQEATLNIPGGINVAEYVVKAFACDAANYFPISGYRELK